MDALLGEIESTVLLEGVLPICKSTFEWCAKIKSVQIQKRLKYNQNGFPKGTTVSLS